MIVSPSWAKLKLIIDGLTAPVLVCTGDDSHYMLYVAKDGLIMSYKLNKELAGVHSADAGLTDFEDNYKSSFL